MTKKLFAVIALAGLILALGACSKDEDKPIVAGTSQGAGRAPAPGIMMPAGEPQVVVPDAVKAAWAAVTISIEDKAAGKIEDVKISLGSEYAIPGSSVKILVGEFLPDFKMDGTTISSSSNELNNPAVRVTVTEGGKELFKGWLYSKFPAIHPFQHEKYGLLLKGGIKKG